MISTDFDSIISLLSELQRSVVISSATTANLIIAGPGTGKTLSLIYRLAYLIQVEGLSPGNELLVLSFSRSAVAEIRQRLMNLLNEQVTDDLRFINIRTFDSFATQLLSASNEDYDLSGLDYDARIALAVKKLRASDSEETQIISGFRHIVVDELQDLVGFRAQLVQEILKKISGGFTLFGDPAQGIYDYQVLQNRVGPDSITFLNWIRTTWAEKINIYNFSTNYRALSTSAMLGEQARALILDTGVNETDVFNTLKQIVQRIDSIGSIQSPGFDQLNLNAKNALLCRTNSDVLIASHILKQQGFPIIVPPKSEDKGLPAWVGYLFSDWLQVYISPGDFHLLWNKKNGNDLKPGPFAAWNLLKALEGKERENLDIRVLKTRLRKGIDWPFDSESQEVSQGILVTTIHQSKGREYSKVLILPVAPQNSAIGNNAREESRVLYVATTRAKEAVFRIQRTGLPVVSRTMLPSGIERFTGQMLNGTHIFEVLPGDVDQFSYVSKELFPTENMVQKVQSLLWDRIVPGTQLSIIAKKSTDQVLIFLAWKNPLTGKVIPLARMTDSFQNDLVFYLQKKSRKYPANLKTEMSGITVFERQTILLPPFPENIHEPYASSGFCIGLGIKGIVTVE